jgi:hypothetical protein
LLDCTAVKRGGFVLQAMTAKHKLRPLLQGARGIHVSYLSARLTYSSSRLIRYKATETSQHATKTATDEIAEHAEIVGDLNGISASPRTKTDDR